MAIKFSEHSSAEIQEILKRYPAKQAALLPVLWIAQGEFGWISEEVMGLVARTLDLSPAHVYGVVTFYTIYLRRPPAKYEVQVCRTLPCSLMGCGRILDHLKARLGIEVGETTGDGRFALSTVECLASCDTGPVVRLNGAYHENLTPEKVDELLEGLK